MLKRFKQIISFLTISLFSVSSLYPNALADLRKNAGGLYSSFTANFNLISASGSTVTGKIYYRLGQVHIRLSNGHIIATNGRHIWFFNPRSAVCAKQDVGGVSGGLLGVLASYSGKRNGNSYVFTKPNAYFKQIMVRVSGGMVRNVHFIRDSNSFSISLSAVKVGGGIPAGKFTFKPPPHVRVVENPLNR